MMTLILAVTNFCCFYLIFTVPWWKIVIAVVILFFACLLSILKKTNKAVPCSKEQCISMDQL